MKYQTLTTYKSTDWATRTPQNPGDELRCSGDVHVAVPALFEMPVVFNTFITRILEQIITKCF